MIAAIGLSLSTAHAAPSIEVLSKSTLASMTTVTGTATFPDITDPESVGGDAVRWDPSGGDLPPEAATALGLGLQDALIVPIDGGLRFVWQTDGLPANVPPEGVRYTWSFGIGASTYQLQAKLTNLASITTAEEPVEHVVQLRDGDGFFQLRGACEASYQGTPTAGCYHLAFLNGEFNYTTGAVSIDLPYETKDRIGRLVAPNFKPGATLNEILTANMSIAASVQAVVSNTTTSAYINGWRPYYTAPRVDLATGSNPAITPNFFPTAATLTGNSFAGTISGTTGTEVVFARGCLGASCSTASL